MPGNYRFIAAKQVSHLVQTEPYSVAFKPYVEGGFAVLRFIKNNFAQLVLSIIHFPTLRVCPVRRHGSLPIYDLGLIISSYVRRSALDIKENVERGGKIPAKACPPMI